MFDFSAHVLHAAFHFFTRFLKAQEIFYDPYRLRQTEATRRMAEDMAIRNLAPRTIDSYTTMSIVLPDTSAKCRKTWDPNKFGEFQLWMLHVNESSWSQFNQAVCALRFFYTVTAPREWVVTMIPFGKRQKKLPAVLSPAEVHDLIQCVTHAKHRAVLLTLYAAGLRLSEATHLKLRHIDSQRMQLKIEGAKGGKDRYVPLSPRLLRELRDYWKIFKPSDFLFPGKQPGTPLNGAVIQKACKLAAAQARITKPVTPHTLRHSYATGLLEAGVDLMAISRLLGHSSFLTTMIYLHCRQEHVGRAPSPIDWLPTHQCPRWIDPATQSEQSNEPNGPLIRPDDNPLQPPND